MGLVSIRSRKLKTFAAFPFLALIAGAGFCIWEWPSWQSAREVRSLLSAGRYTEAARVTRRWIQSRPRSPTAHFFRAKAAIALGNRREILDGMTQAKAMGCTEDQIAFLRAFLDAQAGRFQSAKPILLRAFDASHEPDPMLDEALARVLMETYDWPNAARVLTRWETDAPQDARPRLWLAVVDQRRGAEPSEILDDYREALKRDPQLPEALIGIAEELAKAYKHEEAATFYDAYLYQKPDDAAGHLGAGRNALGLGDFASAAARLDRALELEPDNAEAHQSRAKLDLSQGDLDAALKHLDLSINLRPYEPAAHYSRKMVLTRLGRGDEAVAEQRAIDGLKADLDGMETLQAQLVKSPKDVALQHRLAFWMFAHGFDAEGVKWAQKILIDHPRHRETCALLADYFERRGDLTSAGRYRAEGR